MAERRRVVLERAAHNLVALSVAGAWRVHLPVGLCGDANQTWQLDKQASRAAVNHYNRCSVVSRPAPQSEKHLLHGASDAVVCALCWRNAERRFQLHRAPRRVERAASKAVAARRRGGLRAGDNSVWPSTGQAESPLSQGGP